MEEVIETSSPIRFLKPFDVFKSRQREKKTTTTLEDLSPLKCLNSSPGRLPSRSSSSSSIRHFSQLTSPSTCQDSPTAKKRRLDLTPVKTSQTPSPAKTKVIKRQLNFGGIFSPSPTKGSTPVEPSVVTFTPTTSSSSRRNSRGQKERKKEPTTPSITTLFKPLTSKSKTDVRNQSVDHSRSRSSSSSSLKEVKCSLRTPIDWSLKTRLRFISHSQSFPFRGSFRASEESTGVTSFSRCVNNKTEPGGTNALNEGMCEDSRSQSTFSPSHSLSKIDLDTSATAMLRQHTMVWMHPHLPWMPLYPRSGVSLGSASSTPSLSINATEVLCKDFLQSLKSAFHLVKTRQCAFFYVCGPYFTVLFRAAGVGGVIDAVHALITPVSRGFKALLEDEHVSFSDMEITLDDKSSIVIDSEPDDDDNDPNLFLETLGLSQQDFPSLSSFPRGYKSGLRSESSVVLISGPDTQSLVNVLGDHVQKIAVTKTGSLAGIPPTILSPVAFSGSTLRPFKLRVTEDSLADGRRVYSLDIHGPILPTNVYNLCETFRSNQAICPFDVTLVNLEATNPFTQTSKWREGEKGAAVAASVFTTQSLADCGLSEQLISDLCSLDLQTRKPLRQLKLHANSVSEFN